MGMRVPSPAQEIVSILREYPGTARSIVQELLQNAGDAGAAEFSISLHGDACAMVVGNDARFTEADLDSWNSIRDSRKSGRPTVLGSKGCGAKSLFHLCDVVILIFDDSVYVNDPLCLIFGGGGRRYKRTRKDKRFAACLTELHSSLKESFGIAFASLFSKLIADLFSQKSTPTGVESSIGTHFLLPLRTAPKNENRSGKNKKHACSAALPGISSARNLFAEVAGSVQVRDIETSLQTLPHELAEMMVHMPTSVRRVQVHCSGPTAWTREVQIERTTLAGESKAVAHQDPRSSPKRQRLSDGSARMMLTPTSRSAKKGTSAYQVETYVDLFRALHEFDTFEQLFDFVDPAWVRERMSDEAGSAAFRFSATVRRRDGDGGAGGWTVEARVSARIFFRVYTEPEELASAGRAAQQLPVAGVAFFDDKESADGDAKRADACNFLPLSQVRTGLPFQINASFAVQENRQDLYLPANVDSLRHTQRSRAKANQLVISTVLPGVAAHGLEVLAARAGEDEARYWGYFPDPDKVSSREEWRGAFLPALVRELRCRKIVYVPAHLRQERFPDTALYEPGRCFQIVDEELRGLGDELLRLVHQLRSRDGRVRHPLAALGGPVSRIPGHVGRLLGECEAKQKIDAKRFAEDIFFPAWENLGSTGNLSERAVSHCVSRLLGVVLRKLQLRENINVPRTLFLETQGSGFLETNALLFPDKSLEPLEQFLPRKSLPKLDKSSLQLLASAKVEFRNTLSPSDMRNVLCSIDSHRVGAPRKKALCELFRRCVVAAPAPGSRGRVAVNYEMLQRLFASRTYKSSAVLSNKERQKLVRDTLVYQVPEEAEIVIDRGSGADARVLQQVPCIPVCAAGHDAAAENDLLFVKPEQCCTASAVCLRPYLYSVADPQRAKQWARFFGLIEEPDEARLTSLLKKARADLKGGKVLEKTMVEDLVGVYSYLEKNMNNMADDRAGAKLSADVPILCNDNVLRPLEQAFYGAAASSSSSVSCAVLGAGGKEFFQAHPNISAATAAAIGIRRLDEILDVDGDYGQTADLLADLRRTIEDYSAACCEDYSSESVNLRTVVREHSQNFDDKFATELFVILDERGDPGAAGEEDDPHDPSFSLPRAGGRLDGDDVGRGPSLFIAGNSTFSSGDFEGIAKFGASRKKQRFDSDGRFGIGMANNFIFTPQLEFESAGYFCAFDPARVGVAKGKPASAKPGARFAIDHVRQHWPGHLQPFDRVRGTVESVSGAAVAEQMRTVFRLPLRKQADPLAFGRNEKVDVEALGCALGDLGTRAQAFLFDKSLRRYRIYRIPREGDAQLLFDWEKIVAPVDSAFLASAKSKMPDFCAQLTKAPTVAHFYRALPRDREAIEKAVAQGAKSAAHFSMLTLKNHCPGKVEQQNQSPNSGEGRGPQELVGATFVQALHYNARMLQLALDHHTQSSYALLPIGGVLIPVKLQLRRRASDHDYRGGGKKKKRRRSSDASSGGVFETWLGDAEFAAYTNSGTWVNRFHCFRELEIEGHEDRCSECFVNAFWHLASSRTQFRLNDSSDWNKTLIREVVAPAWTFAFLLALSYFEKLQQEDFAAYAQKLRAEELRLRGALERKVALERFRAATQPTVARVVHALRDLLPKVYPKSIGGAKFWRELATETVQYLHRNNIACVPVSRRVSRDAELAATRAFLDQRAALEKIAQEVSCPISLGLSQDLVHFANEEHHIFDRSMIEAAVQNSPRHPLTRENVSGVNLRKHAALSRVSEICGKLEAEEKSETIKSREKLFMELRDFVFSEGVAVADKSHRSWQSIVATLEDFATAEKTPVEELTRNNASNEVAAAGGKFEWAPIAEAVYDCDVVARFSRTRADLTHYFGLYRGVARKFFSLCLAPKSVQEQLQKLGGHRLTAEFLTEKVRGYCEPLRGRRGDMIPLSSLPPECALLNRENCVVLVELLASMDWRSPTMSDGSLQPQKELFDGVPLLLYEGDAIALSSSTRKIFRATDCYLMPRGKNRFASPKYRSEKVVKVLGKLAEPVTAADIDLNCVFSAAKVKQLRRSGFVASSGAASSTSWVHAVQRLVEKEKLADESVPDLPLIEAAAEVEIDSDARVLVMWSRWQHVCVVDGRPAAVALAKLFLSPDPDVAQTRFLVLRPLGSNSHKPACAGWRLPNSSVEDFLRLLGTPLVHTRMKDADHISTAELDSVVEYVCRRACHYQSKPQQKALLSGIRSWPVFEQIGGARCPAPLDPDDSDSCVFVSDVPDFVQNTGDGAPGLSVAAALRHVPVFKYRSCFSDLESLQIGGLLCAMVTDVLGSGGALLRLQGSTSPQDKDCFMQWLTYIRNNYMLYGDSHAAGPSRPGRELQPHVLELLTHIAEIRFVAGGRRVQHCRRVQDCYDPEVPLLRDCLADANFLPAPFSVGPEARAWLDFFRIHPLNLRTKLLPEKVLQEARSIAASHCNRDAATSAVASVRRLEAKAFRLLAFVIDELVQGQKRGPRGAVGAEDSQAGFFCEASFLGPFRTIKFVPGKKKNPNALDEEDESLFAVEELVWNREEWQVAFTDKAAFAADSEKFDKTYSAADVETVVYGLLAFIKIEVADVRDHLHSLVDEQKWNLDWYAQRGLGEHAFQVRRGAILDALQYLDTLVSRWYRGEQPRNIVETLGVDFLCSSRRQWLPSKNLGSSSDAGSLPCLSSTALCFSDTREALGRNMADIPSDLKERVFVLDCDFAELTHIFRALGVCAMDRSDIPGLMNRIFQPRRELNPNEVDTWEFLWSRFVSSYERDNVLDSLAGTDELESVLLLTRQDCLVRVGDVLNSPAGILSLDACEKVHFCLLTGLNDPARGVLVLHALAEKAVSSPKFRAHWVRLLHIRDPLERFQEELHNSHTEQTPTSQELCDLVAFLAGADAESSSSTKKPRPRGSSSTKKLRPRGSSSTKKPRPRAAVVSASSSTSTRRSRDPEAALTFLDSLLDARADIFVEESRDILNTEVEEKLRALFQTLQVRSCQNLQMRVTDTAGQQAFVEGDGNLAGADPFCTYEVQMHLAQSTSAGEPSTLYLSCGADVSSDRTKMDLARLLTNAIRQATGCVLGRVVAYVIKDLLGNYKNDRRASYERDPEGGVGDLMAEDSHEVHPRRVQLLTPATVFRKDEHAVYHDVERNKYFAVRVCAAEEATVRPDGTAVDVGDPYRVLHARYWIAQQRSFLPRANPDSDLKSATHCDLYKESLGGRLDQLVADEGDLARSLRSLRKHVAAHGGLPAGDYKKFLRRMLLHYHPDKRAVAPALANAGSKVLTNILGNFNEDEKYRYEFAEADWDASREESCANRSDFAPASRVSTAAATSYTDWAQEARRHCARPAGQDGGGALRTPRGDVAAGAASGTQGSYAVAGLGSSLGARATEEEGDDDDDDDESDDGGGAAGRAEDVAAYLRLAEEHKGHAEADIARGRHANACYVGFSAVHKLLLAKAREAGYDRHPSKGTEANFSPRGLSKLYTDLCERGVLRHTDALKQQVLHVQAQFTMFHDPKKQHIFTETHAKEVLASVYAIFQVFE
eukprot:g10191.t1